ncbi:HCL561Cp [Eremothecium sinecaudum]|uniref:HCL561Cp n=1 Tax=Eremothecium sinecaudum TaxID=45286 RepID=A0A120K1N8_9SACH|nr:HCL561Cp [Eremothecium sinecaudum]AMD19590.1 HCL561Cp [Eremothecium sinecaudum]
MPLSQRLGEKKRYHYGGNPRHTSYSRGGHYQHSSGHYNNIRPSTGHQSSVPYSSPTVSQGVDSRPSRYDPNGVAGKTFSSRTGSRYNPESWTASPTKKSGPETISRYSGAASTTQSRYNAQVGHPPSTAPNFSMNGSYHGYTSYAGQYGTAARTKRTMDSSDMYDNPPGSNGYLHRGGKWRDSSTISSSSSSANTTIQQSDYEGGSSTIVPSSSLKQYKRSSSAGLNASNHYRSPHYNNKYGYQGSSGTVGDGIDDAYEMPKSKKNFEKHPNVASSLINSVPMTTRQVEKQVAYDNKRIDLRLDESCMLDDSENESTRSIDSRHPEQTQSNKTDNRTEMRDADHSYNLSKESPDVAEVSDKLTEGQLEENEFGNANDLTREQNEEEKSDLEGEVEEDEDEEEVDMPNEDAKNGIANEEEEARGEDVLYDGYVDPLTQGPHVPKSIPSPTPYPEPLVPVESYIFPMKETEMKFWLLKNLTREVRISKQKYLLKTPIKSLSEYPFMDQNKLIHAQAIRPILLSSLSKLKRYEYEKTVILKHNFLQLQENWISKCEAMDKVSENVRRQEIEEKRKREAEARQREEEKQRELQEQQGNRLSRRRNRADFVDDAEIESVLLQIDPDYKHHQLAASIPPMILDPVKKFSMRFKDINNLVTDKDKWASRVLTDAVDNFSEEEHNLFVEAYLTYPKKFGKIANLMGGLRSPEECVLHYYRTKKRVKYKSLIMEKNKKRKSGSNRRRKEREKEKPRTKQDVSESREGENYSDSKLDEIDPIVEKHKIVMQQVEIKVDSDKIESTEEDQKPVEPDFPNHADINNNNATEDETEYTTPMPDTNQDTVKVMTTLKGSELPKKRSLSDVQNENNEMKFEEVPELHDRESTVSQGPALINQGTTSDSKELAGDDSEDLSGIPKKKPRHNDNHHRSSYWSVKESDMFPILLKQYGSQWHLISDKLGTKSTTMVRNYYQRKVASKGWQPLLEEGDVNFQRIKQQEKASPAPGTNATELVNTDGIPPQQAPSLGLFNIKRTTSPVNAVSSNHVTDTQDSSLPQDTPSQGLPPQHTPSVLLHNPMHSENVVANTMPPPQQNSPQQTSSQLSTVQQSNPPQQPVVHFTQEPQPDPQPVDISRRSSIRSLLNNSEPNSRRSTTPEQPRNDPTGTGVAKEPTVPTFHNSRTPAAPSSTGPSRPTQLQWSSINSILNQPSTHELPEPFKERHPPLRQHTPPAFNFSPSTACSIDRSSLPVALPPVLAHSAPNAQKHRAMHSLQQSSFNFASDPLAALAAVASAPEALGLLSTNTSNPATSGKAHPDDSYSRR